MLSDSSNSSTRLSVFPTLNTEAIVSTFMPSEGSILFNTPDEEVVEEINIEYAPEEVEVLEIQVNFLIIGGAFSIEENALKLAETLKLEGFNPTHHYQSHNNLNLVALGEFESETSARNALEKARKKGRTASWLKRL